MAERTKITKTEFGDIVARLYRDWGTTESRIPNFQSIAAYVRGEQDTSKYRKELSIDEHPGMSDATINWRPIAVIGPIQNIAAARIMRKEEHIVAVPVDVQAYDEENKYFAKMKARLMLRQATFAAGGDVDMLPRLDGEPETIEELEVLVAHGLKHRLAKDYEDAIEAVLRYSGTDDMREEAIAQLFNYGVAVWKHSVDSKGMLRARLVPAGRAILPPTDSLDYSDAIAMGEEMFMTIAQIEEMYPDMMRREREALYGVARPRGWRSTEEGRVRVVYMEVRGSELLTFERRTTRYGEEVIRYVRDKRRPDGVSIAIDKIYGGYWVVDTDIVFGFGEVPYTPRQISSFDKARFTYVARAVRLVDGTPKGLAVDAIPYVDAFHVAWYKMQQTIATMRPNALFVGVESLIGVPLRDKDKPVTAQQLLKLFAEKNILVGRMRDEYGKAAGGPPVTAIPTSSERAYMQLRATMIDCVDMIRRLYGLNALTDASTPDPDTLTTVARLAEQGTSNALYIVERADRRLMSNLYQGLADRIAVMLRKGNKTMQTFLERVIGRGSMLMIKNASPFYMYDVGITIEDSPDVEERQGLEEAMRAAVSNGLLLPGDIAFIRSIPDPSIAADVLNIRATKLRHRQEEMSIAMQRENARMQQEAAVMSHQAKMAEMEKEAELKIAVWQATEGQAAAMRGQLQAAKIAQQAAQTQQAQQGDQQSSNNEQKAS